MSPIVQRAPADTMELRKLIYEFVVATLPLAVVYYAGWAYLYFYLNLFGINITELHFDNATIFIYAFAPVYLTLQGYWWLILLTLVAVLIVILGIRKLFHREWLLVRTKFGNLSTALQIFLLILALLCVLVTLAPWLQWAAKEKRTQVWEDRGEYAIGLATGERKDIAAGAVSPGLASRKRNRSAASAASPQSVLGFWQDSYKACSEKQALLLIFSDEKALYLLCKSVEDPNQGTVFEIRREFGLASVRFASSGGRR
jgi:hypothetical protein